jgi:hypothetical protein
MVRYKWASKLILDSDTSLLEHVDILHNVILSHRDVWVARDFEDFFWQVIAMLYNHCSVKASDLNEDISKILIVCAKRVYTSFFDFYS